MLMQPRRSAASATDVERILTQLVGNVEFGKQTPLGPPIKMGDALFRHAQRRRFSARDELDAKNRMAYRFRHQAESTTLAGV